jgi:hypothetical protein
MPLCGRTRPIVPSAIAKCGGWIGLCSRSSHLSRRLRSRPNSSGSGGGVLLIASPLGELVRQILVSFGLRSNQANNWSGQLVLTVPLYPVTNVAVTTLSSSAAAHHPHPFVRDPQWRRGYMCGTLPCQSAGTLLPSAQNCRRAEFRIAQIDPLRCALDGA